MHVQRQHGTFASEDPRRWIGPGAHYYPCPALFAVALAASAAITGTQEAATAFDKKATIPANTLKAGTVIHVVAQGIHTATTGTETHDMLLKLGSVTIASKTGIDPANNDLFRFEAWITVRDIGATGHVVATGTTSFGASGTATAVAFLLASTAIDTTAALDVSVTIDRQAAATDADSARLDVFLVEIFG